MRIAINISNILQKDEGWNEMVKTLFQQIATNLSQHHFFFITEYKQNIAAPFNVTNIFITNPLNNRLSLKFWYDYKLSSILKKNKIDVFISPNGICSLRSHVAQLILVKDISLQSISKAKNNGFINKRFQKSLVKANAIVIFNQAEKLKLLKKFPLADEKIFTGNLFANSIFQQKDWEQKEQVKNKYSDGKEYFLYEMCKNLIDPLILLKAFSIFKKRQQSNMQLLLIGEKGKTADNLAAKMATYKYRNEVKIINLSTANEIGILASAYALLHFSITTVDLPLLNAMQTGVPVIVLQNNFLNEITNEAILSADASNVELIAEQMKIIYKDENLRSRMIAAGLKIAENNTFEKTATEIWSAILKTAEIG